MKRSILTAAILLNSIHAYAHEHKLTLPLHIVCEQTDGQVNGWKVSHLFSFPKSGSVNDITANGIYKRFSSRLGPDGKTLLIGDQATGRAQLGSTEGENSYFVQALGFLDDPLFPQYVVGGTVSVTPPLSPDRLMDTSDVKFGMTSWYGVVCHSISEGDSGKFAD